MTRLRGALFGCGMISEFHLQGWGRIPEVEIVGLGDQNIERAEERRSQFAPRARTYSELPALLSAERPDFVDITTPAEAHYEHCLIAKAHGVHIICQKPLCLTLAAASDLVARMTSDEQLFAVHENHRYRPWFRIIRDHFRDGFFGTPHLLRLEQHEPAPPDEAHKSLMERAILLEYGTHLVDLSRALLGEPRGVYARLHKLNPVVRGESLAHVVFEYSQATTVIDIAWKAGGAAPKSLFLAGEQGEAYLEGTMTRGRETRLRLFRAGEVVRDEIRNPWDDYAQSFYAFELECAEAMLSKRPFTQTGRENLQTLACTFAAYESAEQGKVVRMDDFNTRHGLS